MYIIIWRSTHREPFIDTDSRGFMETHPTYDDALRFAQEIYKNENSDEPSPWYFDYKIAELVTS